MSSTAAAAASNPVAELLAANERWCDRLASQKPDLLRTNAAGQAPKVLWIGCSDSRVPESVITAAEPGQIFVARNIANQFNVKDDSIVSALTFGVQALGVEHVVVVGHTSCGGMSAATAAATTGSLPYGALGRYLTSLVELAKELKANEEAAKLEHDDFIRLLTEESVKRTMQKIAKSDVIQDNWAGKTSPLSNKVMNKVTMHGLIHDVGTGRLRNLNISITPPEDAA
ncbi:hypothetical protein V8E36_003692 [Tilletia maclaganii]